MTHPPWDHAWDELQDSVGLQRHARKPIGPGRSLEAPRDLGVDRPPEAGAQVRILPGALYLTSGFAGPSSECSSSWDERPYPRTMPPRKRRQRGYIEQLPSDSWRAVAFIGTDPLTRIPQYTRETVKTYDEAEKALTRLLKKVDEEQAPKSSITVAKAIEQWLEVVELEETTRSTGRSPLSARRLRTRDPSQAWIGRTSPADRADRHSNSGRSAVLRRGARRDLGARRAGVR